MAAHGVYVPVEESASDVDSGHDLRTSVMRSSPISTQRHMVDPYQTTTEAFTTPRHLQKNAENWIYLYARSPAGRPPPARLRARQGQKLRSNHNETIRQFAQPGR